MMTHDDELNDEFRRLELECTQVEGPMTTSPTRRTRTTLSLSQFLCRSLCHQCATSGVTIGGDNANTTRGKTPARC